MSLNDHAIVPQHRSGSRNFCIEQHSLVPGFISIPEMSFLSTITVETEICLAILIISWESRSSLRPVAAEATNHIIVSKRVLLIARSGSGVCKCYHGVGVTNGTSASAFVFRKYSRTEFAHVQMICVF